jgi:hypothetical protein
MTVGFTVNIQVVSYQLVDGGHAVHVSESSSIRKLASAIGLDAITRGGPHFEYQIQVQFLGPESISFEISKRFSELAQLDDSLSGLTQFLPYFPPRGAQRVLTDSHAQERMRLLNAYFHVICRMEEVLRCPYFLSFFCLEKHIEQTPRLCGQIRLNEGSKTEAVSALSVSNEWIATALKAEESVTDRAVKSFRSILSGQHIDATTTELQVWYRLPNSFLCERRLSLALPVTISILRLIPESNLLVFGTNEGRVGCIATTFESLNNENAHIEYLQGISHVGIVTAFDVSQSGFLWTGGDDGYIHRYYLSNRQFDFRSISNSENIGVSAIKAFEQLVFVGLSTGVVHALNEVGGTLRSITLLQGPSAPIVGLGILNESQLMVAHSGMLVDSGEGNNTVQFWDVSEIMSRGTSKLAHWGPSASPLVAAMVERRGDVVVAGRNGLVNVFTPSRTEMTHRARYMFRSDDVVATTNENCVDMHEGVIFIANGSNVSIWTLPPSDVHAIDVVDISTPTLCQSVQRKIPDVLKSIIPPVEQRAEDDLHSWAR